MWVADLIRPIHERMLASKLLRLSQGLASQLEDASAEVEIAKLQYLSNSPTTNDLSINHGTFTL